MTTFIAIAAYAAAIIAANLLAAAFGPAITPINSFLLIGLDLALRNYLQLRLRPWQMAVLIVGTGGVSFFLNDATSNIAVASSVAFAAAAMADWAVFSQVRANWLMRSVSGSIIGAAVDSIIFPTIAFGVLMPHIVALQFGAKVIGGAVWSLIFSLRVKE